MERIRREEQANRAHDLQIRSGTLAATKATFLGLTLAAFAHYTWPMFRRQTLAFKGFLVSTCTIFGLVVGADRALLAHEVEHRTVEERIRRQARAELARQGKVATEPEIAKWISSRKDEDFMSPKK